MNNLMSKILTVETLYHYLTNKIMYVPVYQRSYEWLLEQCRVLLEDILNSVRRNDALCLGQITCSDMNNDEIQITDGQQRFISIMLMGLAIRTVADARYKATRNENYKLISDSADSLVYAKPLALKGKKVLKIALNEYDRTVLEALVRDVENGTHDVKTAVPAHIRKDCRIEPNFIFFKKSFEEYDKKGGDLADILLAIDRIVVNVLYCSVEDAQEIYSNQNSKGLPLSGPDLAKNLLLSKIPRNKQRDFFEKYWLRMEELVYRHNLSDFMTDAMIILNGIPGFKWKPSTLYSGIVEFFRSNTEPKAQEEAATKLLKHFLYYARIYGKYLNFSEHFMMSKAGELTRKLYVFEVLFNGSKGNCNLLYLLGLMEEKVITTDTMSRIMDAFVVGQCRAKFVGQFKGQERESASSTLKRIRNEVEKNHVAELDDFVWLTMTRRKGTKSIPGDEMVKAYFTVNQLGANFGTLANRFKSATRYLFYRMNEVANPKAALPKFNNNKDFIIEHIIPPKDKDVWQKELGITDPNIMSKYVEQIGNHVLVYKTCDDKLFSKKSAFYKKSVFPVTKNIGKHYQWTPQDIVTQSNEYAELFIKAFPIPDKYK